MPHRCFIGCRAPPVAPPDASEPGCGDAQELPLLDARSTGGVNCQVMLRRRLGGLSSAMAPGVNGAACGLEWRGEIVRRVEGDSPEGAPDSNNLSPAQSRCHNGTTRPNALVDSNTAGTATGTPGSGAAREQTLLLLRGFLPGPRGPGP